MKYSYKIATVYTHDLNPLDIHAHEWVLIITTVATSGQCWVSKVHISAHVNIDIESRPKERKEQNTTNFHYQKFQRMCAKDKQTTMMS